MEKDCQDRWSPHQTDTAQNQTQKDVMYSDNEQKNKKNKFVNYWYFKLDFNISTI